MVSTIGDLFNILESRVQRSFSWLEYHFLGFIYSLIDHLSMAQETLEMFPAAWLFLMDNCLKNVVNIEFPQADFWSFKFHLKYPLFALE